MRLLPALARGLLFAAMPFLIYFALQQLEPRVVGFLLLALLALRAPGRTVALFRQLGWRAAGVTLLIIVLGMTLWRSNDPALILAYPVVMNLIMLAVFAGSLLRPPSMIERFARMRLPDLPPEGIAYTRRVTQIWCGFFVLNGSIAAWTAFVASREVWVLYNGLVSYLLMGLLFAGEWLYRRLRFGSIATP